jgi:hypothetical protein
MNTPVADKRIAIMEQYVQSLHDIIQKHKVKMVSLEVKYDELQKHQEQVHVKLEEQLQRQSSLASEYKKSDVDEQQSNQIMSEANTIECIIAQTEYTNSNGITKSFSFEERRAFEFFNYKNDRQSDIHPMMHRGKGRSYTYNKFDIEPISEDETDNYDNYDMNKLYDIKKQIKLDLRSELNLIRQTKLKCHKNDESKPTSNIANLDPNPSATLCYYSTGKCRNGGSCKYAHTVDELSVCKYGTKCKRKCNFMLHSKTDYFNLKDHIKSKKLENSICSRYFVTGKCSSQVCPKVHFADRRKFSTKTNDK